MTLKKANGWLDDNVISLYLPLLQKRQNSPGGKGLSMGFTTIPFLEIFAGMKYPAIGRWTSDSINPFSRDLFLFPILQQKHWFLTVSIDGDG